MREQSWDLLEEYIASGGTQARQDRELAELCDLADEIRALNPLMPADAFAEHITKEIAGQIPVRQAKPGLTSIRLKPGGWASVCAAALLLITLGVLPYKGTLPSVPAPSQQLFQTPVADDNTAVPFEPSQQLVQAPVADDNTAVQKNTNRTAPPSVKSNSIEAPTGLAGEANTKEMQRLAPEQDAEQPQLAILQAPQEKSANVNSTDMVKNRMRYALVEEPVFDVADKVPFKVMTIPEQSPVRIETKENPPSITMVYLAGNSEIVVYQRLWEASLTAETVQQDHMVRIVRDNIVIEVTGNVDRTVLEEFSKGLQ